MILRLTPPAFAVAALATLLFSVVLHAQAQTILPPEIDAALARAKLPKDAISILVLDTAPGRAAPRLSYRATLPVNPASVMKLVTTYAALDLLGPAYTWNTPVYLDGQVRDGTLQGNLIIKGAGDPKLVMERLWLLLRRVQGLGIKFIAGDIILDHSAFDLPPHDPASFDDGPLRPYNAAPDALLLNFKAIVMTFSPDRAAGVARIHIDPPLDGVQLPTSVALQAGECGDYKAALKADFSDASRVRFAGAYPSGCGEKVWSVAYADPASFAAHTVAGQWRDLGGKLGGRVRDGKLPAGLRPAFEQASLPLADVVRDINKYSNNVMAQQVFLSLSLPPPSSSASTSSPATFEASREVVRQWWADRLPGVPAPTLENGSGLSRNERITAQALGELLQSAYLSPVMPELMASLPISGVDGTLRRAKTRTAQGAAHLKTGSLRDVVAIAGYVLGASGRRYVLVAVVNHPTLANNARPVLDVLIDWTNKDLPGGLG